MSERRMLPPVTVDTITYEADGSNRAECCEWSWPHDEGDQDCDHGEYNWTDEGRIAEPGDTLARLPDTRIMAHSPAEVEAWGVTVEEWGIGTGHSNSARYPSREYAQSRLRNYRAAGMKPRLTHRFVTTFPDGSTHTTAWTEVAREGGEEKE